MFGIFRKKPTQETLPLAFIPPAQSRVEIELSKSASAEAAQKAKDANQYLNDLLIANGFTLKIFLAAGGHDPHENQEGS